MSSKEKVTPETLLNATKVVELHGTSREECIAELVQATDCESRGVTCEELIEAIEEREAAAQTVVTDDLAIPHASVAWEDDFQVIVGRSKDGVPFGAGNQKIFLIVLLVTGKAQPVRHLQVLASLAELFKDDDFRQQLIEANTARSIMRMLKDRAMARGAASGRRQRLPELSVRLTEQAVQLATQLDVQAILLAVDRLSSIPWTALESWHGRVIIVATTAIEEEGETSKNQYVFEVPHAGLSRIDRANLGMLLATSNGLLVEDSDVVCLTGPPGQRLDCIAVTRPADKFSAVFRDGVAQGTARIPPAVVLRILSLAIELAAEGREGKAVGTLFVIGDTRQVERRARQLVLNPFHGFARRIRNALDPGLAETIKEYASLDGAFLVASDGTMLSAGTYLIPETGSDSLPGGLGARHQAAASITAQTRAMAIAVSQSTGKVTIFLNGGSVLALERSSLTRW
ncbi:MAG: hypothetical protein Fues2KO_42460 [Fuerstiella sp.]